LVNCGGYKIFYILLNNNLNINIYDYKMSILSTSKLIKNMFINDEDEDENNETEKVELDEEYYKTQSETLFNVFSSNKKMKITYSDVDAFLTKFDVLYKQSYFNEFVEPNVQEYFCKELNFLLLIDFILSYFKINNINFNITNITSAFLFKFFAELGDFFYFINYLDVDEKFTDYLKYMIILYAFHLDRDVIETNFCYIIEIMDEFFQNIIAPKLFEKIDYKNFNDLDDYVTKFERLFKEELVDYCNDINYNDDKNNMIDKLFTLNLNDRDKCYVKTIISTINVQNPKPITDYYSQDEIQSIKHLMHRYKFTYVQAGRYVIYDQGEVDTDFGYDYNYELSDTEDEIWSPTIKQHIQSIEVTDPNYNEYKKIFIFKNYQKVYNKKNSILLEIKQLCKSMKIKYYLDLFTDKHVEKLKNYNYDLKLKTIFGIFVDHDCNNILHDCKWDDKYDSKFQLACEFGHLNIIKGCLIESKGQISHYHLEHAILSPNKSIFEFIKSLKNSYSNLKEVFHTYNKTHAFYDTKIKFY
jgi:hypothetical protein